MLAVLIYNAKSFMKFSLQGLIYFMFNIYRGRLKMTSRRLSRFLDPILPSFTRCHKIFISSPHVK